MGGLATTLRVVPLDPPYKFTPKNRRHPFSPYVAWEGPVLLPAEAAADN
jgi:hypothetical protein